MKAEHVGQQKIVLAATDFSDVSLKAVKEGLWVAQQSSAEFHLGTVGRSGIRGLLPGNTAEKVLDTCDCSILTVKPEGFVSPIDTTV